MKIEDQPDVPFQTTSCNSVMWMMGRKVDQENKLIITGQNLQVQPQKVHPEAEQRRFCLQKVYAEIALLRSCLFPNLVNVDFWCVPVEGGSTEFL